MEGVTYSYPNAGKNSDPVLSDVNLVIGPGEFVALVGPSGCGKSTLLKAIAGLIRPTSGRISVGGVDTTGTVPDGLGYLFQGDALLEWATAVRNVEIGAQLGDLRRRRQSEGRAMPDRKSRSMAILKDLGLEAAHSQYPSELSGGMRKRAALARTLAYRPDMYLMDEPFGALDAQTRIKVGNFFLKVLEQMGQAVLFVTHDLEEAIALADRVIVMAPKPGRIIYERRVTLPRPRDYYESRFADGFSDHHGSLWAALRSTQEY